METVLSMHSLDRKGAGDDTGGKVVRAEMITVCNPQMERGEDLLQFTTSWSAGG